jgi:formylglycine-generating enzyme required for sulfatase activity
MSSSRLTNPAAGVSFTEPKLALIPAGWFSMGSESGQENERPVHRVWVDSFYLAASQVTNAEYAVFLKLTGVPAPPSGSARRAAD